MRNGGYNRWFWVGWEEVQGPVFRKWCKTCRVSFTLLSLCVLAHWHYPRAFVVARVAASLEGTSCRSREFLAAQGVPVQEPDPPTPWSEQQDEGGIQPCHQSMSRWVRTFAIRAARLIPTLTALCVLLDIDLKSVAEAVADLRVTRPSLSPLPVAVGLLRVLHEALAPDLPSDLEECVARLVTYLARRQLPPSHGILRASAGRLVYDSLIT